MGWKRLKSLFAERSKREVFSNGPSFIIESHIPFTKYSNLKTSETGIKTCFSFYDLSYIIKKVENWQQIINLSGPRDFSKKLAGQVSLYNDEGLYEEFNLLNPSEKIIVLLDSGITQTLAEELLVREKDPTQFLTSYRKIWQKLWRRMPTKKIRNFARNWHCNS